MNTRPNIAKSALLAALGASSTWVLAKLMIGISHPESFEPSALLKWWGEVGTSSATLLITAAVGVVVGAYLTMLGLLGTAIGAAGNAKRISPLRSLWAAASTDSLRRILTAGLVTVYVSGAPMASASDGPPPIILVDLGPVDEMPPALQATSITEDVVDLSGSDVTATDVATTPDTWTVAPGDHLWHIAENVLELNGIQLSARTTTKYWRRLIAENSSTIGSNPDLIYPGQLIYLPTP